MIGTVSPRTTSSGLGTLIARLRSYQAVRVSEFESVLLIPAVGSVLVDTQPTRIRLQFAARSAAALELLRAKLAGELFPVTDTLTVEWEAAPSVPVAFR